MFQALDRELQRGNIVADKDNAPKAREPLTAAELWSAAQAGKHPLAGCYELTALYVAMARGVGLDVRGAEKDVRGSGAIGHVVAILTDTGVTTAIDLQNRSFARADHVRALSDLELAAHHYNHRAVAAFLRGDLGGAAIALSDGMLLANTVPQLWSNRAALRAEQKNFTDAIADAERAVALAPGVAVYHYQLGAVRIAAGSTCDGLRSLSEALQRDAQYADAKALVRATLEAHPELNCAAP